PGAGGRSDPARRSGGDGRPRRRQARHGPGRGRRARPHPRGALRGAHGDGGGPHRMTTSGDRSAEDAPGLPRGVRLGVDVGDVRVGLARSDLDGMIATPVETLERDTAVRRVVLESLEAEAHVIMVGLPRSLDGSEGPAARKARDFAAELAAALTDGAAGNDVRLIDERLTT